MPKADEGGFIIDYMTLPGTSLSESDREVKQIEQILKDTPEVFLDLLAAHRPTALGGTDLDEPNHGDFFVRLKPYPRRPIDEIMPEVLLKIQTNVPGVDADLAQLMEDLIGDLTAVPQPIEIRLFADDPAKLIPTAKRVGSAIESIPGVTEMENGVVLAGDALNVTIDPVKASLEGMTTQEITTQVNDYLEGNVATQLTQPLKTIGVRVSLHPGAAAARRGHRQAADPRLRWPHLPARPRCDHGTGGRPAGNPSRQPAADDRGHGADREARSRCRPSMTCKRRLQHLGFPPAGVHYEAGRASTSSSRSHSRASPRCLQAR